MSTINDYSEFEQKCETLVKDSEIRFAALIDPMGNFLVGSKKVGIELLETKEERKKLFMEIVLRVTSRKDFDGKLGPVSYAASRRSKVLILTFPMNGNNVLLISADTNANIERAAAKVLKLFS